MSNFNYLGTIEELSFRIILLLDEFKEKSLTLRQIMAIDYMAVYGADYNVLDYNLHGNNDYRIAEYFSKHKSFQHAVNLLVVQNIVSLIISRKGYLYKISASGQCIASELDCTYAEEYRLAINMIIDNNILLDEENLLQKITDVAMRSIKGEENVKASFKKIGNLRRKPRKLHSRVCGRTKHNLRPI